eukprot:g70372.t1
MTRKCTLCFAGRPKVCPGGILFRFGRPRNYKKIFDCSTGDTKMQLMICGLAESMPPGAYLLGSAGPPLCVFALHSFQGAELLPVYTVFDCIPFRYHGTND